MMELKMELQDVAVKDIVFDPENPNWHSEEEVKAMARSIDELFRLHDPIGYYEDGKCQLICGELRVRAEIQNGASTIKGMKVLLEKPTERLIRELQATENIQRRLDWVSRAETYLRLQEIGMTSEDIQKLISLDTAPSIRRLTEIARILRRVRPEIVERLRKSNAYQRVAVDIAGVIGTRTRAAPPPGYQILEIVTDEDVTIAETVLRQLLQGKISQEEVREITFELKLGNILQRETEEREAEVQKLLKEREEKLKEELYKQFEEELNKKEGKLTEYYQQLLQDKDTSIEALEGRLKKLDKKETEAIAKLRKELEQERKSRKALLDSLEEEREKIRKELEGEFGDRQERLIAAEGKKIRKQVEQALADRETKIKEEERRIKLEQERIAKERRDLKASREKLKDETARAHHMVKELIVQRAELSAMVTRAADERFVGLLEKEEKGQLLQNLKDGMKDDFRLIRYLVPEEVEEATEELRELVSRAE